MRHHYILRNERQRYGSIEIVNHPLYFSGTLFENDGYGIVIVREYFNPKDKYKYYGPIDPCIANDIYLSPRFPKYFSKKAERKNEKGLYPTVLLKKVMWEMRLKPLKKTKYEIMEESF